MMSPIEARALKTAPLSPRYEAFLTEMARQAGSPLDGKAVWRCQRAWPVLANGRMANAAARIWAVPSVRIEGRLYFVDLNTGECYYLDTAGKKRACPDKAYNRPRCSHHQAAERKEREMFGGRADKVFAAGVNYEPPEVIHGAHQA